MPERSEWEAQIDRSIGDLVIEQEALRLLLEGCLRDQEALQRRVAALERTLTRVGAAIGRHGTGGRR